MLKRSRSRAGGPRPSRSGLLLTGDRLRRTLAGARVRVRPLTVDRKALAVAEATIAAEIHEALDVHRNLAPEVALDEVIAVDGFADLQNLGVRELVNAPLGRDADFAADVLRVLRTDAMDVLKRND